VPINDRLLAALEEGYKVRSSEWVIEHNSKNVVSVKKGFASAVKRAGLKNISPHSLRHTAATWMALAAIPMPQIANYLGHKDSRTTERVYAHHHPDFLKSAAKALEW